MLQHGKRSAFFPEGLFFFGKNLGYLKEYLTGYPPVCNQRTFISMSRPIYDYTKTILQKVSFDPSLFCRELEKAVKLLLPHELEDLHLWLLFFIEEKPELSKCLVYLD